MKNACLMMQGAMMLQKGYCRLNDSTNVFLYICDDTFLRVLCAMIEIRHKR